MENQVAALATDGDHEYCYGNVSIVLEATAAEGTVLCHQRTGRASWSNFGSCLDSPPFPKLSPMWELPFKTDSIVHSTI